MGIEGDFERDGAVCVRGLVDTHAVALAREAIDAELVQRLGRRAR